VFSAWLDVSRLATRDALLILSVGGGSADGRVSACIVDAVVTAEKRGAQVFGIVGRLDGYTAKRGHTVIVVPEIEEKWITPLSEAFQAVVWHCLVCHPLLRQ
jgi:D-sedoheptulose 7-phosphate isomerase